MTEDPRPGWERAAALCGHARSSRASDATKRKAQETLDCLGPVERRAFVGVVVKKLPDIGQQLGKTDNELDALVRSAKEKLNDAAEDDGSDLA